MGILSPKVKSFHISMVRPYRYEAFYGGGRKKWQASAQFDVKLVLDEKLMPVERAAIEYRQYIRGGVWIKLNEADWAPDDKPNGNEYFLIPPYAGFGNELGIPGTPQSGTGLSLHWKEDGKVLGGKIYRFGYRETATFDEADEKDVWKPAKETGHLYLARDTPGVSGDWNAGMVNPTKSVTVWLELYFRGYVVELGLDAHDKRVPVKILAREDWTCHWLNETPMKSWSSATRIPDR